MLVSNRTFGVELEIAYPADGSIRSQASLARLLSAKGVPCYDAGYSHITTGQWKVTSDATVMDGCELVSPVLSGDAGLDQLRKVSAVLVEAGFRINKTCGMHVHIGHAGMSEQEKANVFLRYAQHEAELDWMMSASRRGDNGGAIGGGIYCQGLRNWRNAPALVNLTRTIEYAAGRMYGYNRYTKLNLLTASHGHPTIEFRHHQGTIEADKIINWVKFCVAFVETTIAKARGTVILGTAPQLMKKYNSAADVLKAIKKTYRGEVTKSYRVAELLLNTTVGLTRDQLSELVKQDLTQISVILQHFKDKKFGLIKLNNPNRDTERCKYVYAIEPGSAEEAPPAPPVVENVFLGIPPEVTEYYKARQNHFKRLAGVLVEESQSSEAA